MRISKVTTKTGDGGETGLGGGQRVPKDALRVEAFGTVDELNSAVGVVRAVLDDAELDGHLATIQHDLFDLGGDLCLLAADKQRHGIEPFSADRAVFLEGLVKAGVAEVSPLEDFVLPAGELAAAHLHVARCVARRAERRCVTLAREEEISPEVVPYLNRLSDVLFVFARLVNHRKGRGDVLWKKAQQRGDT